MSIQFISKGVVWTDAMKDCVRQRIADPLRKHIPYDEFEIFIHLANRRGGGSPSLWMWIELKPAGGESFEMVLRKGDDFYNLTNDVSINMRAQIKKKCFRKIARKDH